MKKYDGYITLLVLFFVVFLGMRNPWWDQKPGPKRKAKAVISQTISKNFSLSFVKSCKDYDSTTPIATLLATAFEWNLPFFMPLPVVGNEAIASFLYLPIRSSRAPPALLS